MRKPRGGRAWAAPWGNGNRRRRSWRVGRVHPKVTRWAQEECDSSNLPYFIKVITTTSESSPHGNYIRIPGAFALEHCWQIDKEVSLEDAVDGSTWTVAFRVSEESPMWSLDWPEFASQYNLQPGHILVFVLVSQSRFRFTLFNDQGCQIIHTTSTPTSSSPKFYSRKLKSGKLDTVAALKSRAVSRKSRAYPDNDNRHICLHMGVSCAVHHRESNSKRGDVKQIVEQWEEPGSAALEPTCVNTGSREEERMLSAITASSLSAETLPHEVPALFAHVNPISFIFLSKRRDVLPVERRAARQAASRYSRILRNPNSMTVLRPSHVYKDFDCMEIPRRLLLKLPGSAAAVSVLTLVDSTGRSWETRWNARGRHRLSLNPQNWAPFAVHHFLEEGDACVFEATDGEALTILVRIFRVVAIPSGLKVDDVYTHYSMELAS